MDAWLTRMYKRLGARYVDAVIAAAWAQQLIFVIPVGVGMLTRYYRLSVTETLITLGVAEGLMALAMLIATLAISRMLRPVRAWGRGERGSALGAEVAAAAARLPTRGVFAGIAVATFILLPITAFVTTIQVDRVSVGAILQAEAAGFMAILTGGLLAYFLIDVGLRPIRRTLGDSINTDRQPSGIAQKLLAALLGLTLASAASVGMLVIDRGLDNGLLLLTGICLGVTLIAAVVAVPLMALTTLGPIRNLIEGTEQVAAGQLDGIPITSSDELGALEGSFNKMVAGLRDRESLRGDLQASRARIVAASDEARRQVERDLHDGAQQNLVLLKLKLEMARKAFGEDPSRAEALIAEAGADLQQALAELRDLAHGIYPTVLTSDGLPAALAEAAQGAAISTELELDATGRFRPEIEAAVYFCCLEALQNAAKHAGENARATVSLANSGGELRFAVADDGAGFDSSANGNTAGLQNMADRIGALGGRLTVTSSPGTGTTVSGSIPVEGQR